MDGFAFAGIFLFFFALFGAFAWMLSASSQEPAAASGRKRGDSGSSSSSGSDGGYYGGYSDYGDSGGCDGGGGDGGGGGGD